MKIKPDVGNKNFSGGVATQSSPIRKLFVSKLESESHLSHEKCLSKLLFVVLENRRLVLKKNSLLTGLQRFADICNFLHQQFRQHFLKIGEEQY